jgi:hypothetical protein
MAALQKQEKLAGDASENKGSVRGGVRGRADFAPQNTPPDASQAGFCEFMRQSLLNWIWIPDPSDPTRIKL